MTPGGGLSRPITREGFELQELTATEKEAEVGREGVGPEESAAWRRLEDQIARYDRKSSENQRWFKGLKVRQIVTGGAIPVAAGASAPAWLIGGAGAFIVVVSHRTDEKTGSSR